MSECQHDWCYSNFVLTSYPAQYPKICRKCGKREVEIGKYEPITNEYEELVHKFHGEKK